MPDEGEISQKAPRRSKRNNKAKGPSSSSSQTPSKSQAINPNDEFNTPLAQPTPIGPARDPGTSNNAKGRSSQDPSIPSTPLRSHSSQASSTRREIVGGDNMPRAMSKGNDSRAQNARQTAPSRPSHSGTPSIAARPNTLTPGRVSETPSKAYAGPTFHASPAASSLPMPKFFSKSVPNVDKTFSLNNMMEPDTSEALTENEESPFIDTTKLELDRQAREGSPLDIFFQADRKAKASSDSFGATDARPGRRSPFDTLRPEASPSRGSTRHHSRQPTDSSIGGVFDLELSNTAPENADQAPLKPQPPLYDRSISAPSGGITDEQAREEQRQASTIALKKMLLSPQNQRSEKASTDLKHANANINSPSPKSRQQRGSPAQVQSRPSSSPGLASDAARVQRQAALRALAEKQIPPSIGHTNPKPPASNLRKEVTVPHSPGGYDPPEPPSTPTPARTQASHPSVSTRSQVRNRTNPSENGNIPIPGLQNLTINSKQQREVTTSGPSPTTAAIENDLRRILKMDVLGSDGTSGVRS